MPICVCVYVFCLRVGRILQHLHQMVLGPLSVELRWQAVQSNKQKKTVSIQEGALKMTVACTFYMSIEAIMHIKEQKYFRIIFLFIILLPICHSKSLLTVSTLINFQKPVCQSLFLSSFYLEDTISQLQFKTIDFNIHDDDIQCRSLIISNVVWPLTKCILFCRYNKSLVQWVEYLIPTNKKGKWKQQNNLTLIHKTNTFAHKVT